MTSAAIRRRALDVSMGMLLLALAAGAVLGPLEAAAAEPVSGRLLADAAAIAPGGSFLMGVHLRMEPSWHVYWKNPGDAGLATQVQFRLPKGFTAGPLAWPRPMTFRQPGDIVGYGYKDEVLLIARVTAPKTLQPGSTIRLGAGASWLGCADRCVRGKADLSIDLPIAAAARPANEKLFAAWLKRSELPAPDFILSDQNGRKVSLRDFRGRPVVLEWFNPDCPFVKRHHEKLNTMAPLAARYAKKGVAWLAVNSTHYMDRQTTRGWHERWKLPYPVLIDRSGAVGRAYGAKTTPHLFVIDRHGSIAYQGAIDDDPRGAKGTQARNYVTAALDDVLALRPVRVSRTRPYGCSVKYAPRPPKAAATRPKAPAFSLEDQNGQPVGLDALRSKIVVLEWFNPDCPFVKRHHESRKTMVTLARRYQGRGVVWLAVNSTHYMDRATTKRWHSRWNLPYRVLVDRDGKVGRAYGAKTTPHIFIVDAAGGIAYQGAIDDDPRGRAASSVNHVRQALDALLAGKPVPAARTRPYGCSVKYAR